MESSQLYQAILAAVEEDILKALENEDEDFTQRDSHGKTLFHHAVEKVKSVNVFKELLKKVDFTVRDDDGKSAIDQMLEDEDFPDDAEDVFRDFVREKIMGSKKADLEGLMMKGWLDLCLADEDKIDDMDDEVKEFLTSIPTHVDEIQQFHAAVKDDDLEKIKSLLQNKALLSEPDRTGLLPLDKAVILGQTDILEYLVIKHDDVLNLTDNMGRTALHYAGGRSDAGHYYRILTDAGADEEIKDLNGKTPAEIFENPELLPIEVVQDKLRAALERKPRLTKKKKGEIEEEQEEETDSKPPSPSEQQVFESQKPKSKELKPVQMYISPDNRINPPPTTVDGKYVAEHMGMALTMALADIAEKRPLDPIEYLAQWLYKYQETMEHNKKKEELLRQIREEEAATKKEMEMKEARRQEIMRLQEEERRKQQAEEEERKKKEQEELQRKAREAALAQQPGLETVMEEKEDETPKERAHKDVRGQTELHKLASQSVADLETLMNMGYSPADRDINNQTARDIAEENKIKENVAAIDNYIIKLVEMEEYNTLQDLVLAGYDKFDALEKFKGQTNATEDTQAFLNELPEIQEKISLVFKAVQMEGLRDLQQSLERKKMVQAKDIQGRSPLHIAVLVGHKEAVEHIATNFPVAMKCKDNLDRTPLHYANAVSEDMVSILETHGADPLAQDVFERGPTFYKENPDDILAMKASLPSLSEASSQQEQETGQQQEAGQEQEGGQQQEAGQEQEGGQQQEVGQEQEGGQQQEAGQEQEVGQQQE